MLYERETKGKYTLEVVQVGCCWSFRIFENQGDKSEVIRNVDKMPSPEFALAKGRAEVNNLIEEDEK